MTAQQQRDKLLLLGDTGKVGRAIAHAFGATYEIEGLSSRQFAAENQAQVEEVIMASKPRWVVNAVALGGIDCCEEDPERALRLNALLPKRLAELSTTRDFTLVHISSDAVFGDTLGHSPVESDPVNPFNTYALTKYGGDCFVNSVAPDAYVFRLPMLFGESTKNDQFVEKMLARVDGGAHCLRVSDDVVGRPSYSRDAAKEMRRIIESDLDPGLYHLANEGEASLYEVICLLVDHLGLGVRVEAVSHREFSSLGRKNIVTTITSEKVGSLRPWRRAFREYCENIRSPRTRGVTGRSSPRSTFSMPVSSP